MTITTAPLAAAHPPPSTDHGVNESTFHTLWSRDDDTTSLSADHSPMAALGLRTDVPLDRPLAAVEQWNRGEAAEFPQTGPFASRYPDHVTRRQGTYLRDAYVAVVAIEPSTRVWRSGNRSPMVVGPAGTVIGVIDYRVALPPDDVTGDEQVRWSLLDHGVRAVTLVADGTEHVRVGQTRAPLLPYAGLTDSLAGPLVVEATVEADLERTARTRQETCEIIDGVETCTPSWTETTTTIGESLTVRDTVAVTVTDPVIAGVRGRYPNGDVGLAVGADEPWLGLSHPGGQAQTNWRFFVARDPAWDEVHTADADGTTTGHADVHPLQVHAFPSASGSAVDGADGLRLITETGPRVDPPILPPTVALDVPTEPYTTIETLVLRVNTTDHALDPVDVHGLVRGVSVRVDPDDLATVAIDRSALALAVVNRSADTVTVRVRLTAADSGVPIATVERGGYVTVDGITVDTDENGTAIVPLSRPTGAVTARYVPGRWWRHDPAYVGTAAIVAVPARDVDYAPILARLALLAALALLAVVVVDRVTGWPLWPPWRGLS